jgi:hypothetical protein
MQIEGESERKSRAQGRLVQVRQRRVGQRAMQDGKKSRSVGKGQDMAEARGQRFEVLRAGQGNRQGTA